MEIMGVQRGFSGSREDEEKRGEKRSRDLQQKLSSIIACFARWWKRWDL